MLKIKIFDKMYQEFNDLMEPAVNFEFAFNSCQFDSMNLTSETFLHPVKSLKRCTPPAKYRKTTILSLLYPQNSTHSSNGATLQRFDLFEELKFKSALFRGVLNPCQVKPI